MPELLRVHGSHNRFFLLDQTRLVKPLSDAELVALARQVTDPERGVLGGADGLLVVDRSNHPGVLGQMRVINADGSEAAMCGNGLRTVTRYLADQTGQDHFKVATPQADLAVSVQPALAPGVPAYAVEIAPVSFDPADLPAHLGSDRVIDQELPALAPGLHFSVLAVPNPHLIALVNKEQLDGPLLGRLGKELNGENPYFPDGVNVSFVRVLDDDHLFVRTYERGVGFTNACGTGMSAASLIYALTKDDGSAFEHPLTVTNPGGMVRTIVHREPGQFWIDLIGNATVTHRLTVPENILHQAAVTAATAMIATTNEEAAYQAFVDQVCKKSR